MRSAPSSRTPIQAVILLVDDNRDGLIARRSVLEELGYKVVPAGSGSDALKMAEEHNFDLVITDYKMFPMNGLEFIAKLRAKSFTNPIILLSGFTDTLGLRAEATGADVVLQKNSNEIANLVRQARRLLNPARKPAASQLARKRAMHGAG
jgi:CheY-like chemotaxis protein